MALSKVKIYNLTLGALLLQRRVSDPDTDQSNEVKVLNTHWEMALDATLEDCDLDATSTEAALALVETDPNDDWTFAYTYPANCVFFRKIKSLSGSAPDNKTTHIPKQIKLFEGVKVIFTDEVEAVGEYIDRTAPISSFSSFLGLAIAYRLAMLSAPLVVGKGAKALMDSIEKKYAIAKAEAQEHDARENHNFIADYIESEFVETRTS